MKKQDKKKQLRKLNTWSQHSLRFKIAIIVACSTLLTIVLAWGISNVLIRRFYVANTKSTLIETYNNCNDFFNVEENVEQLQNSDIGSLYGYIENPDKLMHKYGIYSKIVKEEVKNINNKIENFSKSIKNTIIFVIADHGLVKTKYINLKNDIPEIYNTLARTTAIESRACGIKLKESILKKDFEKLFNLYLKEDFDLLTCEEVLKLKLFGKNSNQYLKDTIGDYLIVAKKNISLNYDDTSPIFKANHAGLTKDELDIPLIVIDCNKNY